MINKCVDSYKNLRLPGYNYHDGYFFVTNSKSLPAPHFKGKLLELIGNEIKSLEEKYEAIKVDTFQIMPTHIHAILVLDNSLQHLDEIWRRFKAITTLKAKREGLFIGESLWQRNLFEHVIRSEVALDRIRKYILQNPMEDKIPLDEIYL